MKISNKNYNISNNLNKTIILISDLHYKSEKDLERLNSVLNSIKRLNPNYICIPGDIIDKSSIKDQDLLISWFKELSMISKVFISIGNHEFYINKKNKEFGLNKEFFNKLESIDNLCVLDNKNIIVDNINFIGITIPINYYSEDYNDNFDECLDKINSNKKYYNILLCHSPINICKSQILKEKNINLVLCGHMHGGVVPKFLRPIFKHMGIISPNRKLFPKYAYGHIKKENTDILITSGIRVLPYENLNKFFKPEIVKINI